MTWKNAAVIGLSALALTLGARGAALADLVVNGNFESFTNNGHGAGDIAYTSPVTGWTTPLVNAAGSTTGNLLFTPGSADTTGSYYDDTPNGGGPALFTLWGPGNGVPNGMTATSPAGGNFLGLDADPAYSGAVSQIITGLTAGQSYQVGFYWAAAQLTTTSGPTTEQLQVSFGSETALTNVVNNATQGFVPWMPKSFTFTADGPSDTLSFLAIGTPSGLPPFVLLDGVTLNAVPEPSTVVLLGIGLLGAYTIRRLRQRAGSAAA